MFILNSTTFFIFIFRDENLPAINQVADTIVKISLHSFEFFFDIHFSNRISYVKSFCICFRYPFHDLCFRIFGSNMFNTILCCFIDLSNWGWTHSPALFFCTPHSVNQLSALLSFSISGVERKMASIILYSKLNISNDCSTACGLTSNFQSCSNIW